MVTNVRTTVEAGSKHTGKKRMAPISLLTRIFFYI